MFSSTFWLSIAVQPGAIGVNQASGTALAIGAVSGFSFSGSSCLVLFGRMFLEARTSIDFSLVNSEIHSSARSFASDFWITARSEPPMKDGRALPLGPGMPAVAILPSSSGLPFSPPKTEPASQPLP